MADAPLKPLYSVNDVVEAACELLPPLLADDVRKIARMVPKADKDQFFQDRKLASWVMVSDILGDGQDEEAGRIIAGSGDAGDNDAASVAKAIRRFRNHRRRGRWDKFLTFCLRLE